MNVFLWTAECRRILLILSNLFALFIERLCDRNQEQKGNLPVRKLAVLNIIRPNSCPYNKGCIERFMCLYYKNLDNIREARIRE